MKTKIFSSLSSMAGVFSFIFRRKKGMKEKKIIQVFFFSYFKSIMDYKNRRLGVWFFLKL